MATSTMMKKLSLATAGAALITFGVLSASAKANDNIVVNGGFETGDLSGWNQSGNAGFTGVNGTWWDVNSGNYAVYSGPIWSLGFLSQTLATNPGQNYELSYFMSNNYSGPNQFQTLVDGNVFNDLVNFASQGFTQYTHYFTATGLSTNLTFGFRQDPSYIHLDDVSVKAVPEPTTITSLLALGALGAGSMLKRKQQQKATVKA